MADAKILSFNIEGIEVVINNLERIKGDFDNQIQEGLADYMVRVLQKAQEYCPVKTGALVSSLYVEQESKYGWFFADGVYYGIYQEFGFRHAATGQFIQNPFAMPAFYTTSLPIIKLQ